MHACSNGALLQPSVSPRNMSLRTKSFHSDQISCQSPFIRNLGAPVECHRQTFVQASSSSCQHPELSDRLSDTSADWKVFASCKDCDSNLLLCPPARSRRHNDVSPHAFLPTRKQTGHRMFSVSSMTIFPMTARVMQQSLQHSEADYEPRMLTDPARAAGRTRRRSNPSTKGTPWQELLGRCG